VLDMMHNAASFLDAFVQDEVDCRCLTEEDFGQPLDNEENDVPLYDMYNRGLAACQEGNERQNLSLAEGRRPGLTGYIPSAEEGAQMGAKPRPRSLVVSLDSIPEEERELSAKRRGLLR
jgi:hypothetical protein